MHRSEDLTDSFKSRPHAQGRRPLLRDFQPEGPAPGQTCAPAVSLKILSGEPAAVRGRVNVTVPTSKPFSTGPKATHRCRSLHPRARDPAGLHRRALRGGSGRDARRGQVGGQAESVNPLGARGTGHDHSCKDETAQTGPGGTNKIEFQRNGERYHSALGRPHSTIQSGAAQHRHRAPGQSRVTLGRVC